MDSNDLVLEDESHDATDQVPKLGATEEVAPRRRPHGTTPPPPANAHELIGNLERDIAAAPIEERAPLYKALAHVWEEQLGRERSALDAWIAADGIDGNDAETLHALARLYRSTQSWDELAQTLRRSVDIPDLGEDEAIALYAQLGELEGDVLRRADEAIAAWRSVVAIDASDVRALRALETLFVRESRWEDAIDVLEKRALVLDDDAERVDTLLQAAAIWEENLADLDRAAELYARVRAADPANQVANERAVAILRERRQWAELVELLLERSETNGETAPQIRMLHEVAAIYERELGDRDSAFYVLQAAFNHDYADKHTASELERLATTTKRWQELLDEYAGKVAEVEREDTRAAVALWVTIGRWYDDQLSHIEYAMHAQQQALRLDPANAGALAAIARLQRKRGSWSELCETLQRHADVESNAEAKTALYVQLGDLLERQLHDVDGAIRGYEHALDHTATSPDALAALDRLYRRTEQWAPLVAILARRAELATDRELAKLRLEIGELADVRLHDAGRAITAYRDALAVDPENADALRALAALYEKTEPSSAKHLAVLEQLVAIDERDGDAYRALARVHEQTGDWEALVAAYRDHIAAATDAHARVDLYCAMGHTCETRLHDAERAVAAYGAALALDPDESRALDALGRLYEHQDEIERAVDALTRLVRVVDDPKKQVELYVRVGRLQYGRLGDGAAAEASLERALAIAPSCLPAMEALIEQHRDRGDWLKTAQMMVRADENTRVVTDRVRLLFEAASIYQHRLRQDDRAKQLYAQAIALDPEHVDAARPLADLYFHAEQWIELRPVIEMLCRKVGQLQAAELVEVYYRAARCTEALGDRQRALQYYRAAFDVAPGHLATLIGRADLLFEMRDFEGAGGLYQTLLAQHRDAHGRPELARIYHRLGVVRRELGERKKALAMFDKALELDPAHRETLEAAVELHGALDDWEAVVRTKRALAANAADKDKVLLLDQISGIYVDKLANAQKATAALVEALEVAPDDRRLLQKLLDLNTTTKQWRRAVETIERFAALEPDAFKKGVYLHAAATVCRDELKSADEAVDHYNRALDRFFAEPEQLDDQQLARALKSFEAIDQTLTAKRDWKAQERAYHAMIKRLAGGTRPLLRQLHVSLFDGLGEIYRSRLKQYAEAIAAFEVAQQMDPDNALSGTDRAEILAELHVVAGPESADKAIEQHMRMIAREPFKYDSYKALARLYADTNRHDKRWCLSRTLAFLRKADPDDLQFYEQYKPRGLVTAKHAMSPDSWKKLAPADENRYVSAIFGAVWQSVAAMKAFPHKDFGVKRDDRRQLEGDSLMFSKLFLYVAQVLNVQVPDVYLIDDGKTVEMQLANAIEKSELCPSFMVRPHLLQGKNEREIAFLCARRLAFMRPEYYLRMLLPTNTELMVVLLSALALLQPGFAVPANIAATVEQYLPQLRKRMPSHAIEQASAVAQRFVQAAPKIDLATWSHAVDAASHRAGFVACGDLEVAARMIAAEPPVVGAPKAKDKLKELVLFSISEDYFAIRAQMGVAIGAAR